LEHKIVLGYGYSTIMEFRNVDLGCLIVSTTDHVQLLSPRSRCGEAPPEISQLGMSGTDMSGLLD